jgi:hypothetical protein
MKPTRYSGSTKLPSRWRKPKDSSQAATQEKMRATKNTAASIGAPEADLGRTKKTSEILEISEICRIAKQEAFQNPTLPCNR